MDGVEEVKESTIKGPSSISSKNIKRRGCRFHLHDSSDGEDIGNVAFGETKGGYV